MTYHPHPAAMPLPATRQSQACRNAMQQGSRDMRWHALDLLRTARAALDLKDRDLAVLRALLSLLPASSWGRQMVVFASNRALAERCDGIEERTLRRRIARLAEVGLVTRRQSPNGKRYQIRDENGVDLLSFGIDLSPLPLWIERLEHLAAEAKAEELRVRSLKALLRDRLYRDQGFANSELGLEARRMLRRKVHSDELRSFLDNPASSHASDVHQPRALEMSATDGRIDRHIQNPNTESEESLRARTSAEAEKPDPKRQRVKALRKPIDMTIDDCLAAAPAVEDLALTRPKCWEDARQLATSLAPAIGLEGATLRVAWGALGELGGTLAVMGLVQAFNRIRDPNAYLLSICRRGKMSATDCLRMFHSLTRGRVSTGLAG